MKTSMPRQHLQLPAESFYWAILETGSLPRPKHPTTVQLGYLFENVLPVPIEEIQATYRPIASGKTELGDTTTLEDISVLQSLQGYEDEG